MKEVYLNFQHKSSFFFVSRCRELGTLVPATEQDLQ
jgi:hypothetical protein